MRDEQRGMTPAKGLLIGMAVGVPLLAMGAIAFCWVVMLLDREKPVEPVEQEPVPIVVAPEMPKEKPPEKSAAEIAEERKNSIEYKLLESGDKFIVDSTRRALSTRAFDQIEWDNFRKFQSHFNRADTREFIFWIGDRHYAASLAIALKLDELETTQFRLHFGISVVYSGQGASHGVDLLNAIQELLRKGIAKSNQGTKDFLSKEGFTKYLKNVKD